MRSDLFARYRHAQLLAALTLLLVLDPFLAGSARATLVDTLLIVTLISAIVACSTRRRHAVIGVSLAVGMQAAVLLRSVKGIETASIAMSLLALCFFGYVIALVLGSVFRDSHRVSIDTICGGLSAYLLLGIAWVRWCSTTPS